MYEYAFIRCPIRFAKAGRIDEASYQDVVKEHTSQGWRLVQIFVENPATIPSEYVIIFERLK